MKLTKTQYKKLEKLIRIADSEKTGKDIKLQIYVCNALHNREWLPIGVLPKEYEKWPTVYMKFSKWSKNAAIAKSYCFFSSKP